MAFKVETGQGLEDANAYVDVPAFKDYCGLRSIDVSGKTDEEIQGAIVNATDWIDANFTNNLLGSPAFVQQALQFPRSGLVDATGNQRPLGYMPPQLAKATCILAIEALNGKLWTNVSGASQQIIEDTIGPVTTKYNPVKPSDMVMQLNFDEARAAMAPLLRRFNAIAVTR